VTGSLFSSSWYRVARLRPRLRSQVQVQRQHWRDQRWYLLSDSGTGRQHRINDAAYRFIGRCDGRHTVHEVWNDLLHAAPDAAPTQDEVLALLGQLGELELVQSDRAGNTEAVLRRRGEGRQRRRGRMLNPFSFRLPLGDPSKWLARLDPLARVLFSAPVFWVWLLVLLASTLAAATEWPALRSHAALHLADSGNLAMAWLLYPLMKTVHELGHALAVRRWGGEVHEAGIGLWLLVPAPYVDASAATAFPSRLARAAVGAAGVIAELGLAALGFWVWWFTQPGLVNQLGFAVLFIGTASTLLFNGNPLLRFDAYHVMCDLFALPNLAARSSAWWNQRLGRLLLASRAEAPEHATGEAKWLWAYAPLSLAYRCVLSVAMVLWLGSHALLLGLAALAYTVVTVLLKPLAGWSRQAMNAAQPGRELARLRLRLGLVVVTAGLLLCVVPLPLSTVAPAVVYLPERAQVRPEVDGFVAELPVADGAKVAPGDLLLRLANPELMSQRDRFVSRLEGLRVEQFQQLLKDGSAAQNLALDIERTQAEVQRAEERIAQLQLRAQVAGTLVMPRQGDLMGAYMRQGITLGHVLAPDQMRVRAAVPEADAYLVRHRMAGAQVRLADAPGVAWPALRSGDMPAATHTLPSAALADRGGGPYTADPDQKDGTHILEPVFLIDLSLAGHTLERVGGRAWVNFDHGSEPLVQQAYRRAAQLFLRHFAPSA
jgi:putative peptide zinc metalloprotease protein